MAKHKPEEIRNVALISHRGAGKTSLAELLLFATGVTEKFGSVEGGDTVCDFEVEEIKRKMSIFPSVCYLEHEGRKVNIVDTPGYTDFIASVRGSLEVVEGAILVVDAVSGVEVQTGRFWQMAEERNLPVLIFVNKLDRENANFAKTLGELREHLSDKIVPLVLPIGEGVSFRGIVDVLGGEALVPGSKGKEKKEGIPGELGSEVERALERITEAAAEANDELTEKYLEEGSLSQEEIAQGLKGCVVRRKLFPVLAGSAMAGVGAGPLLEAILKYLPSPMEGAPFMAEKVDSGEKVELSTDPEGRCTAFVFRVVVDPYIGRLSLLRVFTGSLVPDMALFVAGSGQREKITQPLLANGKSTQPIEALTMGDMGGIAKLTAVKAYDTLYSRDPIRIPPPFIPEPVFSMAIKPETRADEERMSAALDKIKEEDVSFAHRRDQETGEIVISGGGQLHLEIIVDRLKDRYNVKVTLGSPRVPFRETITKVADAQGKYKKQTGGRGQYGDVYLRLEPLPRGTGFEFASEIKGGEVPSQYFQSVEKGILETMPHGILAGYPVVDCRAVLYKGSYHPVDSSDLAFKIAASMAFKAAMEKAGPILLEPVVEVEVTVPEENMGDVMGDLNVRRARISGMDPGQGVQTVKALAPLAEIATLPTDLRSMTQGRGSLSVRFSHYDPAPPQVTEMVVSRSKREANAAEA